MRVLCLLPHDGSDSTLGSRGGERQRLGDCTLHRSIAVEVRADRQDKLQRIEATFDPLPFDARAARAFGRIAPTLRAAGRKPRGASIADYMIAATALANNLPLFTLDFEDVKPLQGLIEVVPVGLS